MLFADDYGFHTGNTWYRGRFRVPGAHRARAASPCPRRAAAPAGAFSVWLNGTFLGTVQGSTLQKTFTFPAGTLSRPTAADNVVSVLTVNMGHDEDYSSGNSNKSAARPHRRDADRDPVALARR